MLGVASFKEPTFVSLDTLMKAEFDIEFDKVYRYVASDFSVGIELIEEQTGDDDYFYWGDFGASYCVWFVFVKNGKIQTHVQLPFQTAATYHEEPIRLHIYQNEVFSKKDAVFLLEKEKTSHKNIDISMTPIKWYAKNPTWENELTPAKRQELQTLIKKVYPKLVDSLSKVKSMEAEK
jgi:hypothetical protein